MAYTEFNKTSAIFSLAFIALSWGSTFAFTKDLMNHYDPLFLLALRFTISSFILFFIFFKNIIRETKKILEDKFVLNAPLILAIVNFTGIAFQTVGLKQISASNSAFITSLYAIFVPFVDFFYRKEKLNNNLILALVIALVGIYLMSYGVSLPQKFIYGDVLTLLCALVYSVYILLVDLLAKKISSATIMFYVFFITGTSSLGCSIMFENNHQFYVTDIMVNFKFLFLILIGTVLPYVLTVISQRVVDTLTTALVLLLEPVFAMGIAILFFGEGLLVIQGVGALLVLFAQVYGVLGRD